MNILLHPTLIITLGLSLLLFSHSHAADFPAGSPTFHTSYDAALKAARESGKPVVMIFSATWCPPCQANKQHVYPSTQVEPFHDKFIWVYLDADKRVNQVAMQKFRVRGIPHIEFLDKDGKSLGQAVGGTSPEQFASALQQVLNEAGDVRQS